MTWRDQYLESELGKETAQRLIAEQAEIIRLYGIYDGNGQMWETKAGLDYRPTKRITNNIKYLIKEVARFMLSRAPEITIQPTSETQGNADKCAALEAFVRKTLQDSGWAGRLSKAGRDQLIAGRVAMKVTGGPDEPLRVRFRPAIEVWAQHDMEEEGRLTKLIYLYQTAEGESESDQRFWVQAYREESGRVLVTEKIVDGHGSEIENRIDDRALPIPYIPSYLLINDGLTGDTKGESEAKELEMMADAYNRTTSDDQDALRFNMYPQTVFLDANPDCLEKIKIAPAAMIDLQTSPERFDGQAEAKKIESSFNYDARIENFLNRLDVDMRKMLGVPPKSLDEYRASGVSGKALKALYWPLITKCEEKWTEWDSALVWMVRCLYDLAVAYGQAGEFAGAEYAVRIEHLYPLTDDEEEERAQDLREVAQGARSVKSYVEKWRPDADSEEELKQIVLEKRMLEEQFGSAGSAAF